MREQERSNRRSGTGSGQMERGESDHCDERRYDQTKSGESHVDASCYGQMGLERSERCRKNHDHQHEERKRCGGLHTSCSPQRRDARDAHPHRLDNHLSEQEMEDNHCHLQ